MHSRMPKVLHPVGGHPLITHVLRTVRQAGLERPVVVLNPGADGILPLLGDAECVFQAEPLGTADAVRCARDALRSRCDHLLVVNGDVPLLRAPTLELLMRRHEQSGALATVLTCHLERPYGFGRVLRDRDGQAVRVVEECAASEEERAVKEVNCGAYCFRADWLWPNLDRLKPHDRGEYYLTDLVGLARADGGSVEGVATDDPLEALGVNTRAHLAEAEAGLRRRLCEELMSAGVTVEDPATVYLHPGIKVGEDTVILHNTALQGRTVVGRDCRLGPNAVIVDSVIGDRCTVEASCVEEADLADEVHVGPFSHIRAGTRLARGAHVGNFAELKKTEMGEGSKTGHFSYLGDAAVGAHVNIGAGTVTCNFDGREKHPTTIEDGAFIGSDTMLVAPVRVGARAITGAGSVVNKDVPAEAVALGVPVRIRKKRRERSGAEPTPRPDQAGEPQNRAGAATLGER